MPDPINLTQLREQIPPTDQPETHIPIIPIDARIVLALIDTAEAAIEVAAGFGGYSDDPPSMLRLRETLNRYTRT